MEQDPQQPRPTFSQTLHRSRLKRWAILVGVGIALLLSSGIVAFVIIQQQNSPTVALQRFCDGYKNHDVQAMYATLSTSYQKGFPLSMYQAIINSQKEEKVNCTVSNVQQHGNTAVGTLTITSPPFGKENTGPLTRTSNPTLIIENGQWKISSLGS